MKLEETNTSFQIKLDEELDTHQKAVALYTESANKLLKALSKRKPNSIIGPNEILTYFMEASNFFQVYNQFEIIKQAIENSNVNTEGFDWDGYWDELNDILKEIGEALEKYRLSSEKGYTEAINKLLKALSKYKGVREEKVSPLEILTYFMRAADTIFEVFNQQEIIQKAIENSKVETDNFNWDDYWNVLDEHIEKDKIMFKKVREDLNMDTNTYEVSKTNAQSLSSPVNKNPFLSKLRI